MKKLFKYLKQHLLPIFFIFILLIMQAFCELTLPEYTSDIVNVGIQQSGVDSPVPQVIRESEMNKVSIFLTDEENATVMENYRLVESGDASWTGEYPAAADENLYVAEFKDKDSEKVLADILNLPLFVCYSLESSMNAATGTDSALSQSAGGTASDNAAAGSTSGSADDAAAGSLGETAAASDASDGDEDGTASQMASMMSQLFSNIPKELLAQSMGADGKPDLFKLFSLMPQEQVQTMLSGIEEMLKDLPDTLVSQGAVAYLQKEYTAVGINMETMQRNYILKTGAKMLALALLAMAVAIGVTFLAARIAAKVSRDLRSQVFHKVISFSSAEFDKFSTASLITRSTNDIQQVQMLIVMMLRMVLYSPILAAGGIYKVFTTNAKMSWTLAVGVGAILIVVVTLFTTVMPKFKLMQKLVDRINLVAREILSGLPVIRAFSTEKYEMKRFDKANTALLKNQLFVNRAMTCMMPLMMLIMNFLTLLIVWVGAGYIDGGVMQVGDMMAFIQYAMMIIMSFLMLSMISIMLPRAAVAAQRVDEVLTTEVTIKEPEKPETMDNSRKGYVEFKDVSFRYPGADENVLKSMTFTAKPGETTAIIGSTGSGKSTLVNLILRFFDVTEGAICVDGRDIRKVDGKDLRDRIGYVPQKGVLFSGTIESNIKYSNPEMDDAMMEKAARIAQATEFIDAKPDKYDSVISQGGNNVSGGQKQRLSIARAIAKKPEIYIFDDSFSALDYKTDVVLRQALKSETSDSTVIIVAQRISTILHADQILVLDEGEIVGKGTHAELMKSCEVYRQIATSQLSEEELAADMSDGKEADDHE